VTDLQKTIDCDVHPTVPSVKALLPYLDDYWRETVQERGINSLETVAYPVNSPLTSRPEWRGRDGQASTDTSALTAQVFDRWQAGTAILNCLYGATLLYSEDLGNAFAKAINDWTVKEWLDRDARLRASIVIPTQNVEYCVDEIERCAKDKRFVQVLVLAAQEVPLGRRSFWPVYAACERHGLPLGIHAGSTYRHSTTSLGWPSFYIEDYASHTQSFQSQVASLVCEGVLVKYPGLKVVLLESGVTWLPSFLWRFSKFWRGVRSEVPWIDRSPADIVRDHFRLTIQPFDAPEHPDEVERAIEHMRSDALLLYASDYPHWQFEGDETMPAGIPAALQQKIMVDNPRATYPRLA
jgi:predicted TIM-barrel fold metal-dependent hydrolase